MRAESGSRMPFDDPDGHAETRESGRRLYELSCYCDVCHRTRVVWTTDRNHPYAKTCYECEKEQGMRALRKQRRRE